MRDKFKVALPDSIERDFISDRMKEYATQGLARLAASSGYVFMLSDFSVENSDQGCVLSLVHPLSTYLKAEEPKAIIRITCARDHMTALGKSTFTQGRLVKVSCLGKKVSWDPNTKVLDVIPFAIY